MLESGGIGTDIRIKGRHRLFPGAVQGNGRHTLLRNKALGLPGEELESRSFGIIIGSGAELSVRHYLSLSELVLPLASPETKGLDSLNPLLKIFRHFAVS